MLGPLLGMVNSEWPIYMSADTSAEMSTIRLGRYVACSLLRFAGEHEGKLASNQLRVTHAPRSPRARPRSFESANKLRLFCRLKKMVAI